MPLLLFFSLFTLLDFVVLFSVGSQIGLLPTLLLVLATGFTGLYLIRQQGTATLLRARERMAQGELPSSELLTGAALIFGGALMLAPGFLSDALGLLCVMPGARRLLARLLALLNLRWLATVTRQNSSAAQQDEARHDAGWQQHGHEAERQRSDEQGPPLEGDFISRDEPRRRG
ncbi:MULTISPECIES: FxsA family protein [Halomonadaceae]|uniref:FxsA family protein n=1 Tax=Billgrantia aerodenitrificans TaxID=2733483 RepID=A0ABS9AVB5_9GAMM|nr:MULTISPECIES: FxsA family protein [Halomonas]MCE8025644.1 FxsA family protein [Halomonas aerodenitrificans]MCE8038436.1 FxsA family protein [Halomonas sp. MCCC 1A11062]